MRKFAVVSAILLLASIPTPVARSQQVERAPELAARIDSLISERSSVLETGRVGIAVMDLRTGKMLYQRNANEQFNAASNTKIITASAALALLGPDFTYQTAVFAVSVDDDGSVRGDLYLRGRGDPLLGSSDLKTLARQLRLSGIRKIRGGISIDSSYFDDHNLPPHFDEQPREEASFRAPIGASAIGFNAYTVIVRPPASGTGPATVVVEPPNDYVKVTSLVQTVATGRTRIRIQSRTRSHVLELKIMGQIRREVDQQTFRRRVPNPVEFAGSVLKKALAAEGISVGRSRIKKATVPSSAAMLASHESPAMASLARGLGKYSNNFMAEILLKTIGAETLDSRRPATWEDGLRSVRDFLESQVGLEPNTYRYGNGSGLFDSNRFTPSQLVRVLASAHRDFRYGPDLVSSMSISGADGTLRKRMVDTVAERQVRGKTGTLDQVSALSGYAATDGRTPLAFSVLINDFPKNNASAARSLQDDIAETLVKFLETGD